MAHSLYRKTPTERFGGLHTEIGHLFSESLNPSRARIGPKTAPRHPPFSGGSLATARLGGALRSPPSAHHVRATPYGKLYRARSASSGTASTACWRRRPSWRRRTQRRCLSIFCRITAACGLRRRQHAGPPSCADRTRGGNPGSRAMTNSEIEDRAARPKSCLTRRHLFGRSLKSCRIVPP
jgi:hypothetical protein